MNGGEEPTSGDDGWNRGRSLRPLSLLTFPSCRVLSFLTSLNPLRSGGEKWRGTKWNDTITERKERMGKDTRREPGTKRRLTKR